MDIRKARRRDHRIVKAMWRRNRGEASGDLSLAPTQITETFVADRSGVIVGFAVVTYVNDGIRHFGILHELFGYELDDMAALVPTIDNWVKACGITDLLAPEPGAGGMYILAGRRMRELIHRTPTDEPGLA
jgi:hypothetical protein